MKLYLINEVQHSPITIGEAWEFFSNPKNLMLITPPSLHLEITSQLPEKMYTGMIITYHVTPIIGFRMTWVTEITHVDEPNYFVDQPCIGPYTFWHHQHLFREIKGGVEMQDIVHYTLPLGPLGNLIIKLIVCKQLEKIFNFRRQFLEQWFAAIPHNRAKRIAR